MNVSALDNFLWAAGFLGHAAVFSVLVYRGRWREFPVFTSAMGFQVFETVALYLLYAHGSGAWYARVYWSSAVIDFLLQLGVVVELARTVLRPTGTWVQDARKQFVLSAVVGVLVAGALAWTVSPPAANPLEAWEVRGTLFTSLLICELFVAMTLASNRLGLGWRSHVMALGQGLTAWATVAVVIDTLHSFLGSQRDFAGLEHVRMVVYLTVLGYWIVQLWKPEPARLPMSAAMQKYLIALHHNIEYDLGRIDSGR